MFTIESKEDSKKFVSSLRRALKARNVELSHNQVLDAVAIAMGFSGAEELHARLPQKTNEKTDVTTDAVPLPLAVFKYPLRNTGQFDFSSPGTLYVGDTLAAIAGTVEDIQACLAYASSGLRQPTGAVEPEYEGNTDVNWDGQRSRRTDSGMQIFVQEDSDKECAADSLFMASNDYTPVRVRALFEERSQTELPVRVALVTAYVEMYTQTLPLRPSPSDFAAVKAVCDDAAQLLGFRMTAAEVDAFCDRMKVRTA